MSVKIAPVTEAIRSFESVRDRQDGHRQQQHKHEQEKKEKDPEYEVTEQKVNEAMVAFGADAAAKAAGLHANAVGHGPGLKIVLTDGTGVVIRQFTGEEFVRMREAVSKDGCGRGKILDQKL